MNSYDPFGTERRTHRTVVICAVLAALAVVGALVWGATRAAPQETAPEATGSAWPSAPKSSSPPAGMSRPAPPEVDRADPASVAEAFTLMTVTWDTGEDVNETAADVRAAQAFGAEELVLPPGPDRPGLGWALHPDSYTTAEAEVQGDGHVHEGEHVWEPTGEPIRPATVVVTYRWSGTDAEGEPWPEERRSVVLSLVERGGAWEVIEYGVAQP